MRVDVLCRFFTCKNGIILFLQFYKLSAFCSEANNKEKDETDRESALESLYLAGKQLDKFVLLSFGGEKSRERRKGGGRAPPASAKGEDKKAIVIRSALSKYHSYAIVLAPNNKLDAATCLKCECHPQDSMFN